MMQSLKIRTNLKLCKLTAICRHVVSNFWHVSLSLCLCSIVKALTGQSWRSTRHRWSIFLCWISRCQTLGRATSSLALKWDLSVSKAKNTHSHTHHAQNNKTCTHTHALRDTLIYDKHTCPVICKLTCKWYETHTQTHRHIHTQMLFWDKHALTLKHVPEGEQHPPDN